MSTKVKVIIAIVLVAIVTSGVWGFATYKSREKLTDKYEREISKLSATLDALGPSVTCYTVDEDYFFSYGGDIMGQLIDETALTVMTVPSSLVGESYITNPQEVLGRYFKINFEPGAPLTHDLVMEEVYSDTLRDVDIISNSSVVGLRKGDYIDFRIQLPFGEDYIVLSHKRIQSIGQNTFKVYLTEEELNMYTGSLVDYYVNSDKGARIYMTKYIEAGIQPDAAVNYTVPDNIRTAMLLNPNIMEIAWVAAQEMERGTINNILEAIRTVSDTFETDMTKIKSGRDRYSSNIASDVNIFSTQQNSSGGNDQPATTDKPIIFSNEDEEEETTAETPAVTPPAEVIPEEIIDYEEGEVIG